MVAAVFDVPGSIRLRDVSRPVAGETHAEAIQRLAAKAVISGVKLLMESHSEQIFATSSRMDGIIYAVGPGGCSCAGFQAYRRCQHFALWAVTMGEPDNDPDGETAAEVARLESLAARGQIKTTADYHRLHAARSAVA